ncbi:MAG: hypothetical protein WCT41_01205 [Candidatus Paceibacterota bacterium]|jgi:hypothetical protein
MVNPDAFFRNSFAQFRITLRNLLGRHGVLTNPGSNDDEIVAGFEELLARRQTELDEGNLIFITEALMMFHMRIAYNTPSFAVNFVCAKATDEMTQEALRKLLRVSLQDPRFRERFNEHFSKHPMQEFREEGWKWLCEILAWET